MVNMFFMLQQERLESRYAVGDAFKYHVAKTDEYEIAFLLLRPKAKIELHKHTTESELYVILKADEPGKYYCPKGGSHGLNNISDKDDMLVLSVKFFKDITEEEACKMFGNGINDYKII